MRIIPVPVRDDNYAYLLIDEPTKNAAVIDPYDVTKVTEAAEREGVKLISVLTTHHHHDHAGGNNKIKSKYPDLPIYGGSDKVEALTDKVQQGSSLKVGESISVQCHATPCHTQDSICYFVEDKEKNQRGVFTGDTLFIGGCGRFFEGTPEEMHKALNKTLASLPDDTKVYDGHNYSKGNVAFLKHVDPQNLAIQALAKEINSTGETTGKYTIGDEKEHNVFMRLSSEAVLDKTGAENDIEAMEQLRNMKNNFKG